MAMTMTLRDMLENPPGRGTRHVAARYREIESLGRKYSEALADPERRKRFGLRLSKWDKGVIAHIQVPSEENKTNFDVVLQLDFSNGARTALGAEVKVYCNSPSWIFVLAYVANKEGLLIPGYERACGERAIKERPEKTNPSEDYGFDKVVHVAALFLINQFGDGPQSATLSRMQAEARWPLPKPRDEDLSFEQKFAEYERNEALRVAANRRARELAAQKREQAEKKAAPKKSSPAAAAPKRGVTSARSAKSVGKAKAAPRSGTSGRKKRG